jgi:hypothetical protein
MKSITQITTPLTEADSQTPQIDAAAANRAIAALGRACRTKGRIWSLKAFWYIWRRAGRKTAAMVMVLCMVTSASAMSMFRPETKNIDTAKAAAQINADSGVNVTRSAMEQPPIHVNASHGGNVSLAVLPNISTASVSNNTSTAAANVADDATSRESAFTAGQKMMFWAIGAAMLIALIAGVVWWFKRQFPAISAAVDSMVEVADAAAAKKIQAWRVEMAKATTPEGKQYAAAVIADLEAQRGIVATERSKLTI